MNANKLKSQHSLMEIEAKESWKKISEQLSNNSKLMEKIGQKLRDYNPHSVMIVGRGSSDHAGVFAKYLIEIEMGIPTFAAAPSVTTIYNRQLNLKGCLVIIISQSGRSPDILEQAKQSRESGAYCIALLNDETAPLAAMVDDVIPLCAGEEKSVAATKSYLATLSALLQLVAAWQQDKSLKAGIKSIPLALKDAVLLPSQLLRDDLVDITHLVILGRGLGYAISKEIALKLKEVCGIHAEAFSSAEFLHGPVALVEKNIKLIAVFIEDESNQVHKDQLDELKTRGASFVALKQINPQLHPRIAPLMVMQRFYLDLEMIATAEGIDPDKPVGLKKVTKTL